MVMFLKEGYIILTPITLDKQVSIVKRYNIFKRISNFCVERPTYFYITLSLYDLDVV